VPEIGEARLLLPQDSCSIVDVLPDTGVEAGQERVDVSLA
jgi:hypothetical protein